MFKNVEADSESTWIFEKAVRVNLEHSTIGLTFTVRKATIILNVKISLNKKTHVPCFYWVIETRVEERKMPWEHEPQASASISFSSSPNFSRVYIKQVDYELEYPI